MTKNARGGLSKRRIAVLGLGFGQAVHVPVLKRRNDIDLVAVASRNLEKARAVATTFGVPRAAETIQEVLALDLDGIVIALPPRESASEISRAMEAGVPVLAEKPLGADADAAAALAGHRLSNMSAINFCYGELPAFSTLKRVVASGRMGRITTVSVNWITNSYGYRNRNWSWRMVRGQGGILDSHGIHAFNLIETIFGTIRTVSGTATCDMAASFAPEGALPADDRWSGTLVTAGSVFVSVTVSNASGGPDMHCWKIVGENGVATISWNGALSLDAFKFSGPDWAQEYSETNGSVGEADFSNDWRRWTSARIADRWIGALRGDKRCVPGFEEGARAQIISDAADRAAREQRMIVTG